MESGPWACPVIHISAFNHPLKWSIITAYFLFLLSPYPRPEEASPSVSATAWKSYCSAKSCAIPVRRLLQVDVGGRSENITYTKCLAHRGGWRVWPGASLFGQGHFNFVKIHPDGVVRRCADPGSSTTTTCVFAFPFPLLTSHCARTPTDRRLPMHGLLHGRNIAHPT